MKPANEILKIIITQVLKVIGVILVFVGGCLIVKGDQWLPPILIILGAILCAVSVITSQKDYSPLVEQNDESEHTIVIDLDNEIITVPAPLTDFTVTYLSTKMNYKDLDEFVDEYGMDNKDEMERR